MATSDSPLSVPNVTLAVARQAGPATPATGWRANEPGGLTAIQPLNFDDPVENTPWSNAAQPNLRYIVDPSSPSPGDNVGRVIYPAGDPGGDATISMASSEAHTGPITEIYYCIGLKMDPNFQSHQTGVNKISFMTISGFGGGGDPYFNNITYQPPTPPRFRAVLQGPLARLIGENVQVVDFNLGVWHIVEYQAVMNSPGVADGIYRQWVDGTLTAEFLNVEYSNTVYDFNFPKLENTWGGGGDVVIDEFYLDVSELYVSYNGGQ